MLTNLLDGIELDFWIATIEDEKFAISDVYPSGSRSVVMYFTRNEDDFLDGRSYVPSRHSSDGFPLIEKHLVSLQAPAENSAKSVWTATMRNPNPNARGSYATFEATGPTALVAGMRCIVMSRYGADVPDDEFEKAIRRSEAITQW